MQNVDTISDARQKRQTQHHVSHRRQCVGRRDSGPSGPLGAVCSTLISTMFNFEHHCLSLLSHTHPVTFMYPAPKDFDFVPDVVVHTYNLNTWRHDQDHHKFKANLVWIASSGSARAT